jgi:arginine deiminase
MCEDLSSDLFAVIAAFLGIGSIAMIAAIAKLAQIAEAQTQLAATMNGLAVAQARIVEIVNNCTAANDYRDRRWRLRTEYADGRESHDGPG